MESLLFSVARIVRKMSPLAPESETSKSPAGNSLIASSFAEKVMNLTGVGYCQGQNLVKATKIIKANKATKLTKVTKVCLNNKF